MESTKFVSVCFFVNKAVCFGLLLCIRICIGLCNLLLLLLMKCVARFLSIQNSICTRRCSCSCITNDAYLKHGYTNLCIRVYTPIHTYTHRDAHSFSYMHAQHFFSHFSRKFYGWVSNTSLELLVACFFLGATLLRNATVLGGNSVVTMILDVRCANDAKAYSLVYVLCKFNYFSLRAFLCIWKQLWTHCLDQIVAFLVWVLGSMLTCLCTYYHIHK